MPFVCKQKPLCSSPFNIFPRYVSLKGTSPFKLYGKDTLWYLDIFILKTISGGAYISLPSH